MLNYDSFQTFGDQFSFWEQRTRSLFVSNGSSPSFKSKLLWQVQLSAIALKALNVKDQNWFLFRVHFARGGKRLQQMN